MCSHAMSSMMNKEKIWTGKLVPATQLESVGVERITSLVWRPFHLISTPPPPPSRPAPQGHGKLVGWLRWHYWSMEYSWVQGYGERTQTWPLRWGDWVSSFEGRGWGVLNSPELSRKVHSSSNLSKETFWPLRDHNRTRFTRTYG